MIRKTCFSYSFCHKKSLEFLIFFQKEANEHLLHENLFLKSLSHFIGGCCGQVTTPKLNKKRIQDEKQK